MHYLQQQVQLRGGGEAPIDAVVIVAGSVPNTLGGKRNIIGFGVEPTCAHVELSFPLPQDQAFIGQRVDLLYHKDSPKSVEVRWQQKSYGYLTPVDLKVNCRVKRDKNNQAQISPERHKPSGGKVWEP